MEFPEEKYWDLSEVVKTDCYSDWEGMYSEDDVKWVNQKCDALLIHVSEERAPFVRDMMAHFLVESIDQAGIRPDDQEIETTLVAIEWFTSCRYWMKREPTE